MSDVMVTVFKTDCVGRLPAGDIFDFGFWTSSADGSTLAQVQTNVVAFVNSWWAASNALWKTTTTLDVVKTRQYDITDLRHAQAAIETAVGLSGASAAKNIPQECAICVSLRTDLPTKSGRGRFYLPAPVEAPLTDVGELSTFDCQSLADNIAAADITMAGTAQATHLIVVSRLHHTARSCTSIDVGNVLDVQRRRRNRLVEARSTASL